MGARVVFRHVVTKIADPNLRVYIVWLPIHAGDNLAVTQDIAGPLADPRVRHFWVPEDSLTQVFKRPLGMSEGKAWDVFLLYDGKAEWGETPPVPSSYMHQRQPLPTERTLDARTLAAEARRLLAPAAS
jgi:hypothetical protein